eukprot:TRINITY_DN12683_c0_g1_i1.p1 TRINITY_DN12683_c0_g1~~TRINITY_DN12683_c0_g1_i1.p1  ORF type:complete len:288 (-),score=43.89 TRINITY_DN12683_c0_g1_i1:58-921(-)
MDAVYRWRGGQRGGVTVYGSGPPPGFKSEGVAFYSFQSEGSQREAFSVLAYLHADTQQMYLTTDPSEFKPSPALRFVSQLGYLMKVPSGGLRAVHRYVHQDSGAMVATTDPETIGLTAPGGLIGGYKYAGILGFSPVAQVKLERFYSPKANDHCYKPHYQRFRDAGYTLEPQSFSLSESPAWGSLPVHEYYNARMKDHFYTTDPTEIGTTTPGDVGKFGYVCKGSVGYIVKSKGSCGLLVAVYRYFSDKSGDHFYTTSVDEIGTTTVGHVGKHGYTCEGILGYVWST